MRKLSLCLLLNLIYNTALSNSNYGAISIRNPQLLLDVTDDGADIKTASGASLHYSPKMPTIVGIETSIKDFTLGFSQTLTRSEAKEEQKFTDYNIKYYLESIGIDAIYSEFLGFRLSSAEKLDLNNLAEDQFFRRDFAIKTANLNLYYFPIRVRWNLSRSLDPSKNEQTTGFGIGLLGSYSNVGIDTQFGLIPEQFQSTFGQDGSIKSGSFESSALSAALAGTLALRPLFLSIMGTTGAGQDSEKYITASNTRTNSGFATRHSLIAVLGLSTQSLFIALQASVVSPRFILRDLSIKGTHTEATFKLGFKF